eukprot:6242613-Pyramimonas_sp.AAC.1
MAMTHYALATITVAHPRLGQPIWIEGLPQSARGSRAAVRKNWLRAKQSRVAPKSLIVRSSLQDAKWAAKRVMLAGYSI